MHQVTPLIGILVAGLGLAFLLGTVALRCKISPLVGYLLAGILIGPFTPGFVADGSLALELAEVGVILLMFGVGLHFSIKDLLIVRHVAVPGALVQVAASVAMGFGVGKMLGMPAGASIVFGIALSVASTVVLLRTLQEENLMNTERGRLAVGWLVIQDVITVLALVLLPAFQPLMKGDVGQGFSVLGLIVPASWTIIKVVTFIALMLVLGKRLIPRLMHYVAQTGSKELFRLSLLTLSLGVAFVAARWFDVSFALGAFLAGMVLSETDLSQRAMEEMLPFRDAFAVLFFVSVGMLFNPAVLITDPWTLFPTVLVILVGTPLVVILILRRMGQKWNNVLFIASGLAQIGEFSFILAALGIQLGLMQESTRDIILGASIISIFLNPAVLHLSQLIDARIRERSTSPLPEEGDEACVLHAPYAPTRFTRHVVIVGCGRVGSIVATQLAAAGWQIAVSEISIIPVALTDRENVHGVIGNAVDPKVREALNLRHARLLIVAIPETFEAGQIIEKSVAANRNLTVIARAHFDEAVAYLKKCGASRVIMGEREIAAAMVHFTEAGSKPPALLSGAAGPINLGQQGS
ncbi:CPA2 family monovalent cation:H+ antiporter-2 [Acetobacteraceae bacterium EV16G]|uniref:CPA2 family monovalent cation:H+ antiporter-2 n=1 Tax=Sorlinia euscelidii TaxID=3081148 RepID=A0ABU7U5D3_9PROT